MDKYKLRVSISTLLTIMMIGRIYLPVRLITFLSKWRNEHAFKCCDSEGIEANTSFALKAILKERPFITVFTYFALTFTFLGIAVRNFERAYYDDIDPIPSDDGSYQDYNFIWNGMWLIVVTMTTGTRSLFSNTNAVGFGDYYPRTHMGRAVIVCASFVGVFVVSLFIVTLTELSTFSLAESKAFDLLFRLTIRKKIEKAVAKWVKAVCKRNRLSRQLRADPDNHNLKNRLLIAEEETNKYRLQIKTLKMYDIFFMFCVALGEPCLIDHVGDS